MEKYIYYKMCWLLPGKSRDVRYVLGLDRQIVQAERRTGEAPKTILLLVMLMMMHAL